MSGFRYLILVLALSLNLKEGTVCAQASEKDSVELRKNILELEEHMWTDYPVELLKANNLHLKALSSLCVSCKARSFKLIGKFYWANGEYPRGLIYFRKAVMLATVAEDRETLAATLDLMGNTFYYQAYYDSAFYFFDQALKRYEAEKNIQGMITVLHNTSLMYHRKGNFQKSIEYLFKGEQLKDQLPESIHEIEAMGAMGNLMIDSIYYDEEIRDELSDIATYEKAKDKRSIYRSYLNIGKAYRQLEEFDLAASYFVKACILMDELGYVPEWNMAAIDYRDGNRKDSCFYYHFKTTRYFSRMTQPIVAYTVELLGDAHLMFNRPDSALIYYDSALRMNYRMNNRLTVTGIHRNFVNAYTKLGNYEKRNSISLLAWSLPET